jgi:alkylation response protein AidB-like acyl-CoA dehydrogenase
VDFGWSDEEVAFRKELRQFLDTELPEWWGVSATTLESPEHLALSKEFAGKLAARGWLTPHWPAAYGGRDASAWQHLILGEEMWARGEPRGPQYMNVNWIGPAIIAYGTDEQKREHLPRMARGEVLWCQGFSEPDAGSDLAALRTRADRVGDEYLVNGRKIWTSYANVADVCFLLVRTDPASERNRGISILLVPTGTPGFEVRAIDAVVGPHAFHELVFTDMRVPQSCRLGPENEGWEIIRYALAYERVGAPRYARTALVLDEVAARAGARGIGADPSVCERLARARALCEAARVLAYRVIDERARGLAPSATAYVARAAMVQAERAVAESAMDVLGAEALQEGSLADTQFRGSLAAGLAAGSYEVQLNLVARLLLGLPKG